MPLIRFVYCTTRSKLKIFILLATFLLLVILTLKRENQNNNENENNKSRNLVADQTDRINNLPCMIASKCVYDEEIMSIDCADFESFSQIRLDCDGLSHLTLLVLFLSPKQPLVLDSSLSFARIRVPFGFLFLNNTKGIDLARNPLKQIKHPYGLNIQRSLFDIYKNGRLLSEVDCNRQIYGRQSIFGSHLSYLIVGNVSATSKICPLTFQSVDIEEFDYISALGERFEFMQLNDADDLSIRIQTLAFVGSTIAFSGRLIFEQMFQHVETIRFDRTNLTEASDLDLVRLGRLKNITMIGQDFNHLMRSGILRRLLAPINRDIDVATKFDFDAKRLFQVHFKENQFKIVDAHFCDYKEFPTNRLIIPVFTHQIECNCALLFLTLYTRLMPRHLVDDKIMFDCIFGENFYSNLLSCQFDQKLKQCDDGKASSEKRYETIIERMREFENNQITSIN